MSDQRASLAASGPPLVRGLETLREHVQEIRQDEFMDKVAGVPYKKRLRAAPLGHTSFLPTTMSTAATQPHPVPREMNPGGGDRDRKRDDERRRAGAGSGKGKERAGMAGSHEQPRCTNCITHNRHCLSSLRDRGRVCEPCRLTKKRCDRPEKIAEMEGELRVAEEAALSKRARAESGEMERREREASGSRRRAAMASEPGPNAGPSYQHLEERVHALETSFKELLAARSERLEVSLASFERTLVGRGNRVDEQVRRVRRGLDKVGEWGKSVDGVGPFPVAGTVNDEEQEQEQEQEQEAEAEDEDEQEEADDEQEEADEEEEEAKKSDSSEESSSEEKRVENPRATTPELSEEEEAVRRDVGEPDSDDEKMEVDREVKEPDDVDMEVNADSGGTTQVQRRFYNHYSGSSSEENYV
ncbi:hypothetical protein BXZ70DRAFT_907883 [Cristinia sonorae]|uniref:Zn(2)-C6 fungal-type domain-containing protein n=1 Tax=Cristinia sonorae TaxID=1940300 RepID=A0A8K0UM79_9AGAR|nr:hypothetical protein BXZ70DRAFT_907883 [Cristinia sonorae]